MASPTEIDRLAFRVSDLLSAYIAIHDRLFKFSLRKVIPLPFIFRPVNFGRCFVELAVIRAGLEECRTEAVALLTNYEKQSAEERFITSATDYVDSLLDVTLVLSGICASLANKANEGTAYDSVTYKSDLAMYEAKVTAYQEVGSRMNDLYHLTY